LRFLILVAVLLLAGAPAEAQTIRAKAKQRILEKQQAKQQKQADAVERFLAMNEDERRQALALLPQPRQRQILRRLAELDLLSDDERTLLRGRMQNFAALPVGRRQALRGELQNLRGMNREERRQRLASPGLRESFSDEERQLLNEVFPGAAPQE
jgi:hypothetical protein